MSGAGLGGPYASAHYGGPNSSGYSELGEARGLRGATGALGDPNLVVQFKDLSSIMFRRTAICKDYSLIHCSELIRNDMD